MSLSVATMAPPFRTTDGCCAACLAINRHAKKPHNIANATTSDLALIFLSSGIP